MKTTWSLGICACLLVVSFASRTLAAIGHIVGPGLVSVDGNPATEERITFEVVVDSVDFPAVTAFEWQLGVSGSGVAFDPAGSQMATQMLASDLSHTPPYFLLDNSGWLQAVPSAKGIRLSDISQSLSPSDPSGKSLGEFVLAITDEDSAVGMHSITDPLSFTVLDDFVSTEPLYISQFDFMIVPEPASVGLIALGGLALLKRRKQGVL